MSSIYVDSHSFKFLSIMFINMLFTKIRKPVECVTVFQQKTFNFLHNIGCTRINIIRNKKTNNFRLKYTTGWRLAVYILCHINFLIKFGYIILLCSGLLGIELMWLDQMGIFLWFLIITMILVSERLFHRKYPFFEILCAGWKIQEDIYANLSGRQSRDFAKQLKNSAKSRVVLQTSIAVVGSLAMILQFVAAPKYCTFTYSAIQGHNYYLFALFGFHELLFIFHGWQCYGGMIYVQSCIGAELTICLNALTEYMKKLDIPKKDENGNNSKEYFLIENLFDLCSEQAMQMEWVTRNYRKLVILSELMNRYASYHFLCIHALAYGQMITDVFLMIQLLRMPDTDVMGVLFFAEDCLVCMYMLFKVFKSIAFVSVASADFQAQFKRYLASHTADRFARQTFRSLKTISMKIGPTTTGPTVVGKALDVLINYYICAILY